MMSAQEQLEAATTKVGALQVTEGVRFHLRVVAGPDAGAHCVLDCGRAGRVLIGTSAACDLRLSDQRVSRRHVAVDVIEGRLRVTDLASTNGTVVDGVVLLDGYLVGGEIIRIGGSTLEVERLATHVSVALSTATSFGPMVGGSVAMRRLYPLCARLAVADIPVVIEGETGTGKEVLAEALHLASPRAQRPYVVFDCTSVPGALLEAELFGYERGAFSGASVARAGVLESAQGGTLLLDEIGDLELSLQPKLLRVIERGEFRRIGGRVPLRLDVRFLAATRRNLDEEVAAGRFRDDLFHRIAVARLELPPLRGRKGDVTLLAETFRRAYGVAEPIPPALLGQWERDSWPGNVRALKNAVLRYRALGDLGAAPSRRAAADDTDDAMSAILARGLPLAEARDALLACFEDRYVEDLLVRSGGNMGAAAERAGIAKRYLQVLKARAGRRGPGG